MSDKERIRALLGNIKNWSWDVFPKFPIEKEDAEALLNLDALVECVEEIKKYKKVVKE